MLDATALLPTTSVAGAQTASFARNPLGIRVVDVVYRPDEAGYWVLCNNGEVHGIGVPSLGSAVMTGSDEIVALAPTPDGNGYWIFDQAGRVQTFGNATDFGDLSAITLAGPIVDAVSLPDGTGYYMLGNDGGIFSFGSAQFHGSVPQVLPGVTLNQPVVGLVPDGTSGYWLVAADGGLFSFGTAAFQGSVPQVLGSTPLAEPVIGALASGNAYLMVAADGGIFSFGTTIFHGSRPGMSLDGGASVTMLPPVTCADVTTDRSGYLMLDTAGLPYGFGSAATAEERSLGAQARDTHRYIYTWFADNQPIRWASDEPIHYVINNDFGPTAAIDMIHQAFADTAAATGLTFVFDGMTTEYVGMTFTTTNDVALSFRSAYQPGRYGNRWAPVWIGARPGTPGTSLLGVATNSVHDQLRATEIITAPDENGEPALWEVGHPTYVTGNIGYVWGNGASTTLDLLPGVLLHEIGHLLGLDHAGDVDELMFYQLRDRQTFGSGDRLALQLQGRAAFHPTAPGPTEGTIRNNFSTTTRPIGGGCFFT